VGWLDRIGAALRRSRLGPDSAIARTNVVRLFLDANAFLQCRDLGELPWHEIRDAAELELVAARSVVAEIDRLKSDGNSRRARRARKASAMLGQVLSIGAATALREDGHRVALALAPPAPINWKKYPDLDRHRPDDRLVAEALAETRKGSDVIVVSHDVGRIAVWRRSRCPTTGCFRRSLTTVTARYANCKPRSKC
jgi:hypothetical protein